MHPFLQRSAPDLVLLVVASGLVLAISTARPSACTPPCTPNPNAACNVCDSMDVPQFAFADESCHDTGCCMLYICWYFEALQEGEACNVNCDQQEGYYCVNPSNCSPR